MKILLVVRWPVGGIRTYLRYVYRHFDPQRYRLTIVAPEVEEGRLLTSDLGELLQGTIHCQPDPVRFALTVRRACKSSEYDIVHAHGLSAAVICRLALAVTNKPLVTTLHDMFRPANFSGVFGVFRKLAVSSALSRSTVLHVLGPDPAANLAEFFPGVAERLAPRTRLIRSGIEISRFARRSPQGAKSEAISDLDIPSSRRILGFFGRFMAPKGFIYLVRAVQKMLESGQESEIPIVVCVGSGGYLEREKRQLRSSQLEHYFRFIPFVPDPAAIMSAMDGIVMPSRWEAAGLVAMEALVMGVPLISSDCIGLRDVVKNTPTFVFATEDVDSLRGAIVDWSANDRREEFRRFCEVAEQRFDIRKAASQIQTLYDELAD